MPKIDCKKMVLDEICMTFCNYVNECPIDCECYYIMQVREIIENILDDDTDRSGDEA